MPIITIQMVAQDYEKKAEIAKVFTDELSRITGVPKEPISVIFHDVPHENVSAGGVMLTEKFKNQ